MKFIQCAADNYARGRTQAVAYLVIHYTANDGDTAQNNARYFSRSPAWASAHYFVDEHEVVQSVKEGDTAWHCGAQQYKHPECRNGNSIGIELCSRKDSAGNYYFLDATVENAAALTRSLMEKYGIPAERVLRHYDVTGKYCPAPFLDNEIAWRNFKARLTGPQQTEREEGKQMASTPSAWAKAAADWAKAQGLISGDENGDCHWQSPLTREALAVILHRLVQQMKQKQ